MMSMRQTGRRRFSTGTKFQCGAAPSPIRRVLGLECVYCIFIVCVLFVLPWSKRFFYFTMMSMSSEA